MRGWRPITVAIWIWLILPMLCMGGYLQDPCADDDACRDGDCEPLCYLHQATHTLPAVSRLHAASENPSRRPGIVNAPAVIAGSLAAVLPVGDDLTGPDTQATFSMPPPDLLARTLPLLL